jgi:hypothetical protein
MGEQEFHAQVDRFKAAKETSLRFEVNNIRVDQKLKAFERKRAVAELVLRDVEKRGRLLRTQDNDLFFFEHDTKTLWPLAGEEFRSSIYARFGLNPTEDETRFVEREINTQAMTAGHRTDVQRFSHWNPSTKLLYVSLNNGDMLRLDGDTIETIENGRDGVLFLVDRRADPIAPVYTGNRESFNRLFDGLSLAGNDKQTSNMLALLQVWFLAVFFLHALPVRPIVALVGEQGSGKTTLGRRLGLALYGAGFDVSSFRSDAAGEQDFLAAVTSRRFAVFDNADSRIAWLPDHLAKLATGSEIQRRKLYTTNDCVSYKPDCFLILTSRDPKWKRDDVAKRILPIRMDTIEKAKVPEWRLQQTIIEQRPLIWGAMLTIMNTIVRLLRIDSENFMSNHRLADFHWFGRMAAEAIGLSSEFQSAMEALNETQFDLLAEGDERIELFHTWAESKPDEWEEVLTSQQLFTALHERHEGNERDFPFRTGAAVGTWLGRNRDLIAHKLGVRVTAERSKVTRQWNFQRTWCHPVTKENLSQNHRITADDMMTPCFEPKAQIGSGLVLEEVNIDVD